MREMFNQNGSAKVASKYPEISESVDVTVALPNYQKHLKEKYLMFKLKHFVNSSMINSTVDLYRFPILPISVSALKLQKCRFVIICIHGRFRREHRCKMGHWL